MISETFQGLELEILLEFQELTEQLCSDLPLEIRPGGDSNLNCAIAILATESDPRDLSRIGIDDCSLWRLSPPAEAACSPASQSFVVGLAG